MTDIRELSLGGVLEIIPKRFGDERGFFSETYSFEKLREAGVAATFVQDNHSLSIAKGVLRGLHFQVPPFAQDKLVRVVAGSIFDVAVDIRHGSPTFGKWTGLSLSAKLWNQMFVPKGFAHGFVTLEPDTQVVYKVSAPYAPEHERCIRYDDPGIGIEWPENSGAFQLSDKDAAAFGLTDMQTGFTY